MFLGIVAPDRPYSLSKGPYWTSNPVGDALSQCVFALARAGVLEADPDDAPRFRWNLAYTGYPDR